jgi:ubiquinone biosynthesis protein
LLSYLFEVTERFGMETRTELILLQRTMVVVEGVSRSLDPEVNIWDVAKPVVEGYIKDSIGPRALGRDLMKTARVMARFGPRLPALVEGALIRQATPQEEPPKNPWKLAVICGGLGLVSGAALVAAYVSLS